MVHKSQICFNVKLNILLYMYSVLISMLIMFPITELRNVCGSRTKQASNIKLLFMSKMTYMYIMCFPSLLPVFKKSRNFVSIQRTCKANFIDSVIC